MSFTYETPITKSMLRRHPLCDMYKVRYQSKKTTADPVQYETIASVRVENGTHTWVESVHHLGGLEDSLSDCRRAAKAGLKDAVPDWARPWIG